MWDFYPTPSDLAYTNCLPQGCFYSFIIASKDYNSEWYRYLVLLLSRSQHILSQEGKNLTTFACILVLVTSRFVGLLTNLIDPRLPMLLIKRLFGKVIFKRF